jgi:hypothetical protein
VTPEGFDCYGAMRSEAGSNLAAVEEEIGRYLDAESFRRRYPVAYSRWSQAARLLRNADDAAAYTQVGHLSREAFQEFATALVAEFSPPGVEPDKGKDVARLRAVLNVRKAELGALRPNS